jgi:hypothetical protein
MQPSAAGRRCRRWEMFRCTFGVASRRTRRRDESAVISLGADGRPAPSLRVYAPQSGVRRTTQRHAGASAVQHGFSGRGAGGTRQPISGRRDRRG